MSENSIPLFVSNDLPHQARSSRFIEFFEAYLSDSLSNLDEEVRIHALNAAMAGGKRIRPLLVYLFSGRSEDLQVSVMKASVILELVHLATLVHDDILDGAEVRRNAPTIHAEIGSHAAVLLGDALFGYALEMASEFSTTRICSIVAQATRKTCTGEIRQTFSRGRMDVSMDEYIGFINGKTGELFKASCEIGCYLSGEDEDCIRLAGQFGMSLGINYQVFDDLIDAFEDPRKSDKSLGSDWGTGKLTLPILLLRDAASTQDRSLVEELLGHPRTQETQPVDRERFIDLLEKYEILPTCIEYLESSYARTKSMINQFPKESQKRELSGFLASFEEKFSRVEGLKTSNFLAV